MLPVYLTQEFAITGKDTKVVIPHYSNPQVLEDNLKSIFLKEDSFSYFNVSFEGDFAGAKEYKIKENEIFFGDELFGSSNLQQNEGLMMTHENYEMLLGNYSVVGKTIFLSVTDEKLLYELGFSYLFEQLASHEIKDSVFFSGLVNYYYSSASLVALFSDVYDKEGFVKVCTDFSVDENKNSICIADVFFYDGDIVVSVDFGLDELHEIKITKGKRQKIDLGGVGVKLKITCGSKEFTAETTNSELGFFVDTRKKPIRSKSIVKDLLVSA